MGTVETQQELFEIVRETTRLCREHEIGMRDSVAKPSEKTIADYAKIARSRLNLSEEGAGRLMDGVSRQSWVKIRSALLHATEHAIRENRRICDVAQRALKAARTPQEASEALQTASEAAVRANRAVKAFAAVRVSERPTERSQPKASKRRSLPPLAKGEWRQAVYDRATPAMQAAIAVLWAGARPAEVELGIELEKTVTESGEAVMVRIRGAKLTEKSGQEVREIVVSGQSDLGRALLNHAGSMGDPCIVKRPAARLNKDFSKLRAARKIPKRISPYSLRHAFCADLKGDRMDPSDIAKAMGHASARSQGHYGTVHQGRGGLGVVAVQASREPRTEWNRGLEADHALPAP